MKQKHIPGPWFVEERNGHIYVRAQMQGVRFDIAEVFREADAAVIAVVPELIDAVEKVRDALNKAEAESGEDGS